MLLGFADGEEEEEEFEEDDDEVEDEESSEGESEPPESDEDNYIKSEKKFKRVKSAFLDDEAEEEDDAPKDDDEETMHLTLEDDDGNEQNKENDVFRTPSLAATGGRRTQSKLSNPETPFSDLMSNDLDAMPRLTPFEDRTDNNEPKSPVNSDAVRKKLGFESLFDTSDPQVSEIDDVIGLCSGQFFTQKPALSTESSSQDSQEDFATAATPDTVILQPQSLKTDSQLFTCTDTPDLESNDVLPSTISVIRSDDEDDQKMESLTQVGKKKAKKLVLSDDESETEEAEVAQNEEESDIEKDDNAENKEVMYDSEENEVEVPKFKGFIGKKG